MTAIDWILALVCVVAIVHGAIMHWERNWYKTQYEQNEVTRIVNDHHVDVKRKRGD